ncbi:peptidyl-prolyl cis-trans isomerase [Sulfurimonas sp.]
MQKIFFSLLLATFVSAGVYDGVAVVVKGSAITLLDIKKEMQASKLDEKAATDILIRQKLEEIETKERGISVSSSEVYDDIKKMASRNNMTLGQFYDAVRESNGLTSSELKEKIKQKLLSQKLYSAIAMSSMEQPSEDEIEEYYKLHKDSFKHPSSFDVIIYEANSKARLQEKIDNPMFSATDIVSSEKKLPYDKISPELAMLLQKTPLNHFTPAVPNGKGGFMSFYIKRVNSAKEGAIDSVKNQIINAIMGDKREQILSDYFARLRDSADINIIRMPK